MQRSASQDVFRNIQPNPKKHTIMKPPSSKSSNKAINKHGGYIRPNYSFKYNLMKPKFILFSISIFAMSMVLVHSGNQAFSQDKKEKREVTAFSEISLSISADLYLKQGNEHSLVLEGDEDDLEDIETEVRGNELNTQLNRAFNFSSMDRIRIYVTMKNVDELSVSGSGKIEAETPIQTSELTLNLSGSGDINIGELEAKEVDAQISGSGDIRLAGKSNLEELEVDITGSGDLHAEDIQADEADIDISGSGTCRIHAINELEVSITGSGKVRYKGNPRVNANISGSGSVSSY